MTHDRLCASHRAWFASIPEQYRNTDLKRASNDFTSSIILPPPPAHMLTSFFSQFTPHLTKSQLAAKAARENCGKPGRRKDWKGESTPRCRAAL